MGTASRRWELYAGGKVPQPKPEAVSSPQAPLLEKEPQHRQEPPQPGDHHLCLLAPVFTRQTALWEPLPPSHGLQDIHECVQIHARVCEPAATGWTVFVNPLETSQYSPELHLLHALKLTVQATRMTLTDLVQYNVF